MGTPGTTQNPRAASSVSHNMVTTAFELDGYRIVRNLGLVRGSFFARALSGGRFVGGFKHWWAATSRC